MICMLNGCKDKIISILRFRMQSHAFAAGEARTLRGLPRGGGLHQLSGSRRNRLDKFRASCAFPADQ